MSNLKDNEIESGKNELKAKLDEIKKNEIKIESDLKFKKFEDNIYKKIRSLLDSKDRLEYHDVYDLFFNKDNGIIKNKEDLKNISNIKKIVRQLYNNDDTNMQFTFDKIYPGYLKYYNDG